MHDAVTTEGWVPCISLIFVFEGGEEGEEKRNWLRCPARHGGTVKINDPQHADGRDSLGVFDLVDPVADG